MPRKSRKKSAAPPPTSDPVTAYARAVLAGEIIAGPHVRAAAQRHLDDLEHGPARGLTFSLELADRAIGFFRDVLRLNGGEFEGKPFILGPWQGFIVGSLFGWIRADGARRFRTAYAEIGKGNGKSPLAAGIGLYCLCADNEPRAEIYAGASKKDQAMILFRDAVAMVDQSPELAQRLVKHGGAQCWNLSYPRKASFFRAISSDDGQSGPRPHCSLVDELHEHPNGTVVEMLKKGHKGRRQPLTIEITNSGFDRTSICYQHHEYSTRVVRAKPGDANFDDEWFAYVCALDENDDPLEDEACWIKANPNLGVSIQPEYLQTQVREAIGMPASASKTKRLNFCMWVDAEHPWIDIQLWLKCERKELDALERLAKCDEVYGALDLSGTRDLSALSLVGLFEKRTIARVEFWTPADTLEKRSKDDKVPYDVWVERKFITATPGRAVDYRFIAQRIADLQRDLPLRRIAFDPYRISYLEKDIDELSIEIELVPHPQGYYKPQAKKDEQTGDDLPVLWMPRSVELLEKLVGEGLLDVEPNPCLRWNSSSAVQEPDPKNNRIFTKRKSRGRIDGLVALAMSIGLLNLNPEETGDLDGWLKDLVHN